MVEITTSMSHCPYNNSNYKEKIEGKSLSQDSRRWEKKKKTTLVPYKWLVQEISSKLQKRCTSSFLSTKRATFNKEKKSGEEEKERS